MLEREKKRKALVSKYAEKSFAYYYKANSSNLAGEIFDLYRRRDVGIEGKC